jgi:hypothetical protein
MARLVLSGMISGMDQLDQSVLRLSLNFFLKKKLDRRLDNPGALRLRRKPLTQVEKNPEPIRTQGP